MIVVKHKFVSPLPDVGDPEVVSSNAWNDTHEVEIEITDIPGLQDALDNKAERGAFGDVFGPEEAVDGQIALFDGATGKMLKAGSTQTSLTVAPSTVAASAKTDPVDADLFPLVDSAASNVLRKLSWSALKAGLKTYFDTLYTGGAGGGVVTSVVAGDGITVDSTDPANPVVSSAGGGAVIASFPDPVGSFWGPSKAVVHAVVSQIVGDPFVVHDGTNYFMYMFVTGSSPTIKTQYKTALTLDGLAAATATDLAGLANYHKFVLLVDSMGVPVVIGGSYHGYAVKFVSSLTDKEIYHFTCATLTGTWALGSKVIAKGGSGDKDEYNTDTPYAHYDGTTIRLWYMGAPAGALATYGLAIRMLQAKATNPDGPFGKDSADVILPNTAAAWDYGWLGGVQVRARPNGKFLMLYNAGNTRPSTAGTEPDVSAIGFAYADSLDGPWAKDPANPYLSIDNSPSDSLEKLNVWRGHLVYDAATRDWRLLYNTGGSGTERITYAVQNVLDYFYDVIGGSPFNVQAMTTSKVAIFNSRVNLPPGRYHYHAQINVIGDAGSASTPKLDVDTFLRINGMDFRVGRDFIGSYSYENRDLSIDHSFRLGAKGYVDLAVQVTGGTPLASSQVRRLRFNLQRLQS